MLRLRETREQHSTEYVATPDAGGSGLPPPLRWNGASTIALTLVLTISALLMVIYHNRFWAPADDGNYAHVAERLLSGQVLHRDVQDVHAGYVNFVNAAAFSIFGVRLVSLRYPLALLTVLQAGLLFLVLRSRGLLFAVAGALGLTSLSFVQFLNPTANWYCLFLTITMIAWLSWLSPGNRVRPWGTGFLVGTAFLFRQLSGVFLGIGVMIFLVLERQDREPGSRVDLARVFIAACILVLMTYVLRVSDPFTWVLLAVWPLLVLCYAWRRATLPNGELAGILGGITGGALLSSLPLWVYHLLHGSVRPWVGDTLGAAASMPSLDFMKRPGYLMMGILAWRGFTAEQLSVRLNAIYWTGMLLLFPVFGLLLFHALARSAGRSALHPLPVIASFYTLVSLHYQLPVYIYYTAGLALASVLWLMASSSRWTRGIWIAACLFWSATALYYHAAMPQSRHLQGDIAGERRFPHARLDSPRAGIYTDSVEAALYNRLLATIRRETQPRDSILALPTNAELYFLSGRTNPFRFYNSALGIRSAAALDSALRVLICKPPKLVFYASSDKYNTAASVRLAQLVQQSYERLPDAGPFQIFRRRHPGREEVASTCLATLD